MSRSTSPARPSRRRVAFVFSAQGSTWQGMGRDLLAEDSVFRAAILECDASIRRHFDWSLWDELNRDDAVNAQPSHRRVQPSLTSLQIALSKTLVSRGVTPDAVGALSMGEAAAAHSAGSLDLDAAIDVACSAARLADTELAPGLMAFVRADARRTAEVVAGLGLPLCVAVELADDCTVISGPADAVGEFLASCQARAIACGRLPLAQAYHSQEVAALRRPFIEGVCGLRQRPPLIPLYSSATGAAVDDDAMSSEHWWRICSSTARFGAMARRMIRDGYDSFVEIGPHPMLGVALQQAAAAEGANLQVHSIMQRGVGARGLLARVVGALMRPARDRG